MADSVLELNIDLVTTDEDISEYFLARANASALRRVRKSDNNRIARAADATIVNRREETGDEYFTFLTECTTPKTCTILLRGPSKVILNEIDCNLADAMSIARNVVFNPTLGLPARARPVTGVDAVPFRAVADALEVIPRTLVQNAGGNAIHARTALRAKHTNGEHSWGIDGKTGDIVDMKAYKLYESATRPPVSRSKPSKPPSRLLMSYCAWMTSFRQERQQEQGPAEELAQG
ncbi:TCP-1/cpn60 chaperonin family-domain-containing protein [Russula aff. rugulosa BPL654]|nr:TCP-1/cpn60 chaperonin family-domain-containing protein [Russula aff. rugulosa BPL654]